MIDLKLQLTLPKFKKRGLNRYHIFFDLFGDCFRCVEWTLSSHYDSSKLFTFHVQLNTKHHYEEFTFNFALLGFYLKGQLKNKSWWFHDLERDYFENPPKDLIFLQMRIEEKWGGDDWRSFLVFGSKETRTAYTLRGYGSTPVEAAQDAWNKYNDESLRFWKISDYRNWS